MELSLTENKKFLVIDACTELEYEQLKSSLTKKIEGWRFHPLVKKKIWTGDVSFVKRNKIPAGLWKEIIDICKDYDFQCSLKGITDIFDNEITEETFTGDFEEYNKVGIPLRTQQIYAGAKIKKSSNLVIGTYQSLVKKDEEYFMQFDAVFVDETHKAKANSIQKIMDLCWHCDFRFGLSGTIPKKGTVNRLSLMSAMGPLVTQVKASQLQEEGFIAPCKVMQLHMDYATESQKESFAFLSKSPQDRQKLFGLEQNFINQSEKRLDFVCKVIKKSTNNSLVLFHKIAYGEKLAKKLRQVTDKKVYYVDGSVNVDIREEFKSRMEKNNDVIIVASYGTFSTGIFY